MCTPVRLALRDGVRPITRRNTFLRLLHLTLQDKLGGLAGSSSVRPFDPHLLPSRFQRAGPGDPGLRHPLENGSVPSLPPVP